jgi:hypothetical protein
MVAKSFFTSVTDPMVVPVLSFTDMPLVTAEPALALAAASVPVGEVALEPGIALCIAPVADVLGEVVLGVEV